MAWIKKGLIYKPEGKYGWDQHTVLTPTPILLNDAVIRIYAGFRDNAGVSRIGYIDVSAIAPDVVLNVSERPVLDIGAPGCFDDNGMLLGDVVRDGKQIRMYYVGFQLSKQVKFLAYSGLAISENGGDTFERYQETPIMDRTTGARFIRAIHTVLKDGDKWKIWYSVGDGWEMIDDTPYPRYDIRYVQSADGLTIDDKQGVHCISVKGNEYRIGRPRVRKLNADHYEMRYTFDTLDKKYTSGYAESSNGMDWRRLDDQVGIYPSSEGWDSEMLCYPVTLETSEKKYIFYSGNGMGATGIGYAVWENE